MNIRQQKYKANRLKGMNQYNAARAAGYSEAYSRNARAEKVVKGCLADAFERAGLTDQAIVAHAIEGMQANKVISCNVIAQDGEGMKDAHSMTKDFIDVPDWQSRHKYFYTICELTERIKTRVEHSGEIGKSTNIIVIRADGNQTQEMARPLRLQQEPLPGDVLSLGNRQNDVADLAGNVVQRADSE